jgi:hypothetical protein
MNARNCPAYMPEFQLVYWFYGEACIQHSIKIELATIADSVLQEIQAGFNLQGRQDHMGVGFSFGPIFSVAAVYNFISFHYHFIISVFISILNLSPSGLR